jgi:hypothetical protein
MAAADSLGLDPLASKFIAIGATAVMLFGAITPLANPTTQVKAGAVCVKANQKVVKSGKTFVCKKSGKKLVWQIKKLKDNNVVTQPELPRQNTLLETQLKLAYSSTRVKDKAFFTVAETPVMSAKNRYLFEVFSQHLAWLAGMGASINRPLVVLVPDTANWMNAEISRQGCSGYNLSLGGYAIWTNCGESSVITRPNSDFESHAPATSVEAQNGLIHEAFHQWQREAVGIGRGNGDYPKWLFEGGAHAIARYAYWANSGTKLTPEQILEDWFRYERPDLRRSCVGVKIREMIPNRPWPDKSNCAYSKGQVAIDFFVEKFGFTAFLSLYQKPNPPESTKLVQSQDQRMANFSLIFREVTGQEIEQFYNEVDIEMTKRGWE